jgi:hypothetical protein
MFPGPLQLAALNGTVPPLTPMATLVGGMTLSGGLGIITGCGVEWVARELEEKIPQGEQKTPLRYKVLANGLRTTSVVAGTGLATVAGLGLLGVSATAAACVASFGVGLAIVGIAGLCFVVYRYWKKRQKESLAHLLELISNNENEDAMEIIDTVASKALLSKKEVMKRLVEMIQDEEGLTVEERTSKVRQVFQFEADHPDLFTRTNADAPSRVGCSKASCIIL